jgi:hypothetical protein
MAVARLGVTYRLTNALGLVLYTTSEDDLAALKAEELVKIHGDVTVEHVTTLERRKLLARYLDPNASPANPIIGALSS